MCKCDLVFFMLVMLCIPLGVILTPPASQFERDMLQKFKEEKRKKFK